MAKCGASTRTDGIYRRLRADIFGGRLVPRVAAGWNNSLFGDTHMYGPTA